ncbi:MAG: M20/M25/M40 family metallo-hydrolase, partial [Planctomycetota bacterium]
QSSTAGFAVPDRCDAWMDLHAPPDRPLEDVEADLLAALAAAPDCADPEEAAAFPTRHPGYRVPADDAFVGAVREAFGRRGRAWAPEAFRSHSDANLLYAAGCRPVVLGPGRLARAHTVDESIRFDEVAEAARLYVTIADAWLGR